MAHVEARVTPVQRGQMVNVAGKANLGSLVTSAIQDRVVVLDHQGLLDPRGLLDTQTPRADLVYRAHQGRTLVIAHVAVVDKPFCRNFSSDNRIIFWNSFCRMEIERQQRQFKVVLVSFAAEMAKVVHNTLENVSASWEIEGSIPPNSGPYFLIRAPLFPCLLARANSLYK